MTWNNGFTVGIRPGRVVGMAWAAEVWQGSDGGAEKNHLARTMKGADEEVDRRHRLCCWWWTWGCHSADVRGSKDTLAPGRMN